MKTRQVLSYVLFPFTMWYAVGVRVRNALYATGLKKQETPHITTIGVGNLCVGGSGKTPHTEYLLRLLSDQRRVAMLSRGYRRQSRGFQTDDGSHDAALLGDEPAMVAAKFPEVQVAVCENRAEGVRHLMAQEEAPEVVVLDDAFQHRRLKPSVNILLTEYRHPYYRDRILPYGNLREFRSARLRASIVVVTKCPERLNPVERHNIKNDLRLQNYQKVFFSYLRYGALQRLDGSEGAELDLHHMDAVLALTGIAQATPLIEHLKRQCKVEHLRFPDHHDYTARDIDRLRQAFEALPGQRKAIITTEKDAMRLRGMVDGLPIYVQPIEVAFHDDGEFDRTILSAVKENISFLGKLSIWS